MITNSIFTLKQILESKTGQWPEHSREEWVLHTLSAMPPAVSKVYREIDPDGYFIIRKALEDWALEIKALQAQEEQIERDCQRELQWETITTRSLQDMEDYIAQEKAKLQNEVAALREHLNDIEKRLEDIS